jgi:hypothetical protein
MMEQISNVLEGLGRPKERHAKEGHEARKAKLTHVTGDYREGNHRAEYRQSTKMRQAGQDNVEVVAHISMRK